MRFNLSTATLQFQQGFGLNESETKALILIVEVTPLCSIQMTCSCIWLKRKKYALLDRIIGRSPGTANGCYCGVFSDVEVLARLVLLEYAGYFHLSFSALL